jgi:ATP adenylyltransferase
MKFRFHFAAGSPDRYPSQPEFWDEVIYESENFVALPTRGALVEGWLLIVPRIHHLCIGEFAPELVTELESFHREVRAAVRAIYGATVAFEHGPASSSRPAGCGVDHAHLHVVPWRGPFASAVRKHGVPQFSWRSVSGYGDLRLLRAPRKDYLYFEESDGDSFAACGSVPSQYFRRIVAAELGTPELFDWKEHSGIANVKATVSALQTASGRMIAVQT